MSRGLGDVYKRQLQMDPATATVTARTVREKLTPKPIVAPLLTKKELESLSMLTVPLAFMPRVVKKPPVKFVGRIFS